MLGKINVLKIVIDHLKTFRSVRTGKFSFQDLSLFIVFPLIISVYFVLFKCYTFDLSYVNILIAALSILTGFLFNLLAMIFGFMDKLQGNAAGSDVKTVVVQEIHTNISFSILLAIFCIISLLFCNVSSYLLRTVSNLFAVFSIVAFFLSLLMVLKRIYIIMSKELK